MGLYDREYVRDERPGFTLGGNRTMVTTLILINVAVYLVEVLLGGDTWRWLAVNAGLFREPWYAWQLLTSGFAHDPQNILHIGFNMFALWVFGRDVEDVYGKLEFLRIYLALVVLSSLSWVIVVTIAGEDPRTSLVGASGAVTGIVILFVLHFPRRILYIWGVLPIPAWALGILFVALDLFSMGGARRGDDTSRVAVEAHLAGAAFAFLYYQSGINFGRLMHNWRPARRPQLRVHDPRSEVEESLDARVDRLLDKVGREGIDSLTDKERQMLEDASRRYQRRRS